MSVQRYSYGWLWAAICVLLFAAASGRASAANILVAGDQGRLWVVRSNPPSEPAGGSESSAEAPTHTVTVFYRMQADANEVIQVETLRGQVRRGGVAAAGNSLWIAYDDGTLQRLEASPSPIEPGWIFHGQFEALLPGPGELRALAASPHGPWALMRLPAEALAPPQDDAPQYGPRTPAERAHRRSLLGLQPWPGAADAAGDPDPQAAAEGGAPEQAAPDGPSVGAPEEAPATSAGAALRDHLLELRGGQWIDAPLPADWPQDAPASLVMGSSTAQRPILLVYPQGEPARVYRWVQGQWRRTDYDLPRPDVAPAGAVLVQGQLVVCQSLPRTDPVTVALSVLRSGQVRPIGELAIQAPPGSGWDVAPVGLTVAMVVRSPRDQEAAAQDAAAEAAGDLPLNLHWARMDLAGRLVQPPARLSLRASSPWKDVADYVVMAAIGLLSVLMLVVFWRRDPARNQLALPDQWMLADLPRRGLAGVIDVLPGLLLAMATYELGLLELLQYHWPGNVPSLEGTVPGLLVIGLFVGHTTVSELITRRTLGKALMGLRVTDLHGQPPKWWQLLVRGLLKAFDLVAWLLLVLPMLGPYRQRLGDLLARTVVVMPRLEEEEIQTDDDDEDGRDE